MPIATNFRHSREIHDTEGNSLCTSVVITCVAGTLRTSFIGGTKTESDVEGKQTEILDIEWSIKWLTESPLELLVVFLRRVTCTMVIQDAMGSTPQKVRKGVVCPIR